MKRQILTLAIGSALIGNAVAFTVYDPTLHAQSILNSAQEIAKFVEMINNQVEQIQTLGDHLDEFQHYKELFGDPKAVVQPTVKPLTDDLRKTEPGQTLAILEETANATEAMRLRRVRIVPPHWHDFHDAQGKDGNPGGSAVSPRGGCSEDDRQLSVRVHRRGGAASSAQGADCLPYFDSISPPRDDGCWSKNVDGLAGKLSILLFYTV